MNTIRPAIFVNKTTWHFIDCTLHVRHAVDWSMRDTKRSEDEGNTRRRTPNTERWTQDRKEKLAKRARAL